MYFCGEGCKTTFLDSQIKIGAMILCVCAALVAIALKL
jgi:hypothetical protein